MIENVTLEWLARTLADVAREQRAVRNDLEMLIRMVWKAAVYKGGVPEDQARAHAEAMDVALYESVATKADLAVLGHEIAELKAEIARLETRLTVRMGAMLVAAVGLLLALEKLIK